MLLEHRLFVVTRVGMFTAAKSMCRLLTRKWALNCPECNLIVVTFTRTTSPLPYF